MDKKFVIENNILIDYIGHDKEAIIPEGVKKIAEFAFFGKEITKVTLPKGLEVIGEAAFCECGNLEYVIFDEGLKTVEKYAFSGCGLKEINLPQGTEEIYEAAFKNSYNLEKIGLPDSVKFIGTSAFEATSISKLQIPSGIKLDTCGDFIKFPSDIEELTVSENNPYYCVIDGAIYSKDKKRLVKIVKKAKTITVNEGVEIITPNVIASLFDEITLPKSLKFISNNAFSANRFKEICLYDGLEYIGADAFYSSFFEEIIIPRSVKRIAGDAFGHCRDLKRVYILYPETEIAEDAFNYCNGDFTVYAPKSDAIKNLFGEHYSQLSEEETEKFYKKTL